MTVLSVIVPLIILLTSAAQLIQDGPPLWVLKGLALPSFGLAALVPMGRGRGAWPRLRLPGCSSGCCPACPATASAFR